MFKKAMLLPLMLGLSACSQTVSTQFRSENYNSRIRFLVMHYTTGDWQDSLQALTKGEVSSHYLIPEQGDASYPKSHLAVYRLVDEQHRAWHAGVSHWQGRSNINDQSIGIELINRAACAHQPQVLTEIAPSASFFDNQTFCQYPNFDQQQIQLLIELSKDILARNPDIDPTAVVGHSDIQLGNKQDPGPHFPWYTLYQHGIGAWYEHATASDHWQALLTEGLPTVAQVQCNLQKYGYGIEITGEFDKQTFNTVKAFQLHFLPWQATGEITIKTVAVLFALMDKYRAGIRQQHCQNPTLVSDRG
ncbi:N-acetylmuramoyl-L-alanine amidase [Pseudoalteromonas tunicata]|uniref:N-acetylmuramoyl-L-alanine amidase n=1 Tax=Pseudoalteromonas tunicata TaxID=314281 RepID=UPI00273DAC04|nr:N-acetylmuramoyl-L-alanine amidase [Pseudoalteromonas tunicata]MDP5214089.1 N-acetylmuramoyl-L-alanine amidase [Pseudoalteromonas tunicata]